jgi:transposase
VAIAILKATHQVLSVTFGIIAHFTPSAKAKLKKLSQEKFNCSDDATKALSKISKQFKYHQVDQIEITEKLPSHKDKKQNKYYQISTTVSQNESAIDVETTGAGRFILATNVLESRELSNEQMITKPFGQGTGKREQGTARKNLPEFWE